MHELHVYPKPRGRVLRYIGQDVQEAGELLVDCHLDKVIALKHERDVTGSWLDMQQRNVPERRGVK